MKSTGNKRAVIVGIFIFLGLVIFIITILTLGSQKKTFEKSLTIKAIFTDVNGLQKGNNVWFSGVKIGTIKQVTLAGNARVAVAINIDQKSRQFIRKDAIAKVSSDGFIGSKIIVIYGGTLQAEEIESNDTLAVEKFQSTDAMLNNLEKNNENLLEITSGFKIISKNILEGKGTVGKLLSDESLINELNNTTIFLKKASINLEKLSSNVSAYTAKLQTKGTLADDLVSDTMIFSRLRATVSKFQEAAVKSDSVIDNLKLASNNLNDGLNNSKAPIGLMLHDEQAASTIKTTLKNLQSSSEKLDEDLEALQHNFLLRGFFKKKAKDEKKNPPDTIIIQSQ